MNMLSRTFFAAVMVAALLLSACGNSAAPSPQAQAPSGTGESGGTAADPGEPVQGGTLVRAAIYGDPQNLDPIVRGHLTSVSMITWNIYEPLIRYDAVAGKFVPANAQSWSVSEDGKTYSFTLKQGVKFHNGREVVAEDFKYSLERLMDPQNASPGAKSMFPIEGAEAFFNGQATEVPGIKVVDDHTLEITLAIADNSFLHSLTMPYAAAVPKEEVEAKGASFSEQPVGAGPFMLTKWVRDSEIELTAFEDYHQGRAYLDKVVYKIMNDQAARDNAFASKQLDMMTLGDAQYGRLKNDPSMKDNLVEVPEVFTRNMKFNLQKEGPWQDVRVRQAINHAIDRETIVKTVLQDKAYPAIGILPTTILGHNPNVKSYEYNPEKAKQLLAEAGYPNGFDVTILTTSHPAYGLPAVEAVAGYLKEVGINLIPEQVDSATATDRLRSGDYEFGITSNGGNVHPAAYLATYFHSRNFGASGNNSYYQNEKVDQLLDEAIVQTDEAEMIKLVQEAEEIIMEEAPWWSFNYNKAVIAHQPWVKGVQAVPTDIDFQDLTKIWIDPSLK